MTLQGEARLYAQGLRAPRLEIVNGRCAACRGHVYAEQVQGGATLAPLVRIACYGCSRDMEYPLTPPAAPIGPLEWADRGKPGRPSKGAER